MAMTKGVNLQSKQRKQTNLSIMPSTRSREGGENKKWAESRSSSL
jgi:hypothetical protein